MAKKQKPQGHDPLAWMAEDEIVSAETLPLAESSHLLSLEEQSKPMLPCELELEESLHSVDENVLTVPETPTDDFSGMIKESPTVETDATMTENHIELAGLSVIGQPQITTVDTPETSLLAEPVTESTVDTLSTQAIVESSTDKLKPVYTETTLIDRELEPFEEELFDEDSAIDEDTAPFILGSPSSGWITVSLQSVVTLASLNDLKAELHGYLGQRVQLVGSHVERVDTAALQLLTAFINNPDVTVGWVEPSPELCHAAHLLGLSAHLCLPAIE